MALGVIVTALIQALLAGLGLWFSGVPHAGLLMALAFMLCVAQLGPFPVLVPAVGWLYWTGNAGGQTALLIWSLPVVALDNIVRPILIRRGVQLPLLLIIGGVIGGLIGFGVVGLFVGPVVLAATYTLAKDWVARGQTGKVTEAHDQGHSRGARSPERPQMGQAWHRVHPPLTPSAPHGRASIIVANLARRSDEDPFEAAA